MTKNENSSLLINKTMKARRVIREYDSGRTSTTKFVNMKETKEVDLQSRASAVSRESSSRQTIGGNVRRKVVPTTGNLKSAKFIGHVKDYDEPETVSGETSKILPFRSGIKAFISMEDSQNDMTESLD